VSSSLGLLVRLVVSMGIVLGLMSLAARWLRARGPGGIGFGGGPKKGAPPVRIEVLARQSVGKNTSIAVVRTLDRALVLGVTEQSVTVLAEADCAALGVIEVGPEATWTASPGAAALQPGTAWKAMLELARVRTLRRS
jgi:flagellar protein FliO/FliZ